MIRLLILFILLSTFATTQKCEGQNSYCFGHRIILGVPDSLKIKMSADIKRTYKQGCDYFISLSYKHYTSNNKSYYFFSLKQKEITDTNTVSTFLANNTNMGVVVDGQFIPIIRNLDEELFEYNRILTDYKDTKHFFPFDKSNHIRIYILEYGHIFLEDALYNKKKYYEGE